MNVQFSAGVDTSEVGKTSTTIYSAEESGSAQTGVAVSLARRASTATCPGTVKLMLREQAGAVGMTSPFESCRPRYCVPSEERATSKLSVMTRLQQVSSDAEEVLDKSMNGQESLGLTRRFEPSHLPFTLPRRLVRDLGSIVLVLVGAVDDGWHDLAVSGAVASQLVGDEPPGWPALPLQQLTKEAFSGSPIASRLDEDIDDVAILVHRTPEILPLTLDGYKHLVQVPRIAEATLPSLQPASVFWTELDAPKSDRFIRDGDPALGKEVLYISKAQTKAMVEPNGVADDLRWKSISAVARRLAVHWLILSVRGPT